MKERLIKMAETTAKANTFQKALTTLDDVEEMIKTDLNGRISTGPCNGAAPQQSCGSGDSFGSADIFDLDSLEKLKIDCSLSGQQDGLSGQQEGMNDSPQRQHRSRIMSENDWRSNEGQASPASAGKKGQISSDLMSNVASQGKNSSGDLLADIADVIAADALVGTSEHQTNGSAENTSAAQRSPSSSQAAKRDSGPGQGRMTNNLFRLETSPGQRSNRSIDDDLIDLIQLEEGSLDLVTLEGDSAGASTPKSSDTLQAYEVEVGESSLCFLDYNDDSIDSLEQTLCWIPNGHLATVIQTMLQKSSISGEADVNLCFTFSPNPVKRLPLDLQSSNKLLQCDQCNSILVEKGGKRGRPARQKVERPTHYQPILPRPPLPNGQMTTCPYHVPQRTVYVRPLESPFSTPSPQTSDTALTVSTRDSCSSDRDILGYRCDASSGTTGSSRHSSSDTDGPHHNLRLNNGSINARPQSFQVGSPLNTSTDVNLPSYTQIRPSLGPLEQSFSGVTFMNNKSYIKYSSNMPNQSSTLPWNSAQHSLYEPGHHGLRPQHQLAAADRGVIGNYAGPQQYNPHTHPGPVNHLVTPSEKLPNNIAALSQTLPFQNMDPSYGTYGATAMQSPINGQSRVPYMSGNEAMGNHLNGNNHFSPALTGSSNAMLPQNGNYQSASTHKKQQKEILVSSGSNQRSAASSGYKCNISNPTCPNEKPKLNLPYENKSSIVCQWINSHVGDPPPDSGYYPNQSFTDYGNHEQPNPESQKQPNSKVFNNSSPGRDKIRSKASTSDMSFTSSTTPSSFKLDWTCGNSEMFSMDMHNFGISSSPLNPSCPRPQSEFDDGMSKSSIGEVEKIEAILEIESKIIEMKEKSLENHKNGLAALPTDGGTKCSSLDDILLSEEVNMSLLAGVGLPASQLSNSSSFDRSKYLTPNDISSLEAKKHQSGKTSFDEYLGNAAAVSQSTEPAQKSSNGHGHLVYYNPDFGPEVRGLMRTDTTSKESSDRSNSQHMSKPVKRKPEDAQRYGNFLPYPASSTFSQLNGTMHQQMNSSRRNLVELWIDHLPLERNIPEQQCLNSFPHSDLAQAINMPSAQPTLLSNSLMRNWSESKMASAGLSNQHPVSTSDASMMSETDMSIENSLGQLEEHQHNALINGLMDMVDMITTSVGSNERNNAVCDTGSKQSMDDYHFSKVMNFLEPDIPPSMASPNNALLFTDTLPHLSNTNSCNYLRNHLQLQQAPTQSASGRHQASPCVTPSFDDGLILSPRGPVADKASAKAAPLASFNGQSPACDQQPAEITISSLDSSKISGDSYLSKLSYSSMPEQVMGPDSDGETCLHFLCDMPAGSLEEIKQQPGFREALDLQNKKQETALFIAVKRSNVEITNFLLSNGANPNIICSCTVQGIGAIQHSALHEAVHSGNLRMVKALLSAKDIVVDAKSSYGGLTPLMLALAFHKATKQKDIIMLLIEKKASLTMQETQGRTPLMLAIQSRDVGLVETILTLVGPVTARALVNASDKKGLTCLHIAAGLTLNTQDKKKLLQCIITAGGDASVKNIEGETPRDWAKNEITEVLQNLAKVNKT